jgi:hypothetical protein
LTHVRDTLRARREPVGCEYGAAVLIAVLLFSETTVAKLAGHAITLDEVRRVVTAIAS